MQSAATTTQNWRPQDVLGDAQAFQATLRAASAAQTGSGRASLGSRMGRNPPAAAPPGGEGTLPPSQGLGAVEELPSDVLAAAQALDEEAGEKLLCQYSQLVAERWGPRRVVLSAAVLPWPLPPRFPGCCQQRLVGPPAAPARPRLPTQAVPADPGHRHHPEHAQVAPAHPGSQPEQSHGAGQAHRQPRRARTGRLARPEQAVGEPGRRHSKLHGQAA